jgi:hypothetical protein
LVSQEIDRDLTYTLLRGRALDCVMLRAWWLAGLERQGSMPKIQYFVRNQLGVSEPIFAKNDFEAIGIAICNWTVGAFVCGCLYRIEKGEEIQMFAIAGDVEKRTVFAEY